MRISTFQLYQQGLNGMLDQQASLAKTQQQLSAGKKILSPSDDPSASTRILKLGQLIDVNTQYQRNADSANTQLSLEDNVLTQTGDILQRVRELAVQANNAPLNAQDRLAIAAEVRSRLGELLQAANTKDASGKYLFAGFRSGNTPFSGDGSGNFTYAGDQGQQLVQIGPSLKVATSDAGDNVFMRVDNGSGGVSSMFSALYDFATNLESNSLSPNTLTRIDSAINSVLNTRASIGARLNAIDSQKSMNDTFDIALRKNRSTLEDLDYAKAISQFQRQSMALQASQQSFAKIEKLSLFNYL